MRIGAHIDSTHAFVLKQTDVEQIWAAFSQLGGTVEATAKCIDDVERHFGDAKSLTQYENARPRAIHGLTIRARSADRETSARLELESRRSGSSIDFYGDGEDDLIAPLKDAIAGVIDELRPWYSVISRIDFYYVFLGVGLVAFAILKFMAGESRAAEATLDFRQALSATLTLFGVLVAIAGGVWLLNRLRIRCFPVGVFAIGRGSDRFEVDEKIRWVVIVGFVVSVFASVFAAFLIPAA